MKLNRVKLRSVVGVLLFTISAIASADWNPKPHWKDSYSVGGVCYCDSTNYDHNLSGKIADTPIGPKNVVQICNDIRRKLGTGPTEGRIPYNDIQCGHGPANDAADETGCPGRVDLGSHGCGIKGPRWNLQAVYGVAVKPAAKPESKTEAKQTPKPAPKLSVKAASNQSCSIVTQGGVSLTAAKQQFATACPGLKRRDCDPVSGKRWMCSTDNIPSSFVEKPVEPTTPSLLVASEQANGVCEAQGSTLGAARQAYALSCPDIPRRDCDPTDKNQWTCSSGIIGSSAPGKATAGGVVQPVSTPIAQLPVQTPAPILQKPTPSSSGRIGKVGSNDLVALHYDNCPDRDDGHALASGKAVVVRSGLQNVLVVNGTCGDSIRNRYQRASEDVLRAVWGSQWLDSFNDLNSSVQASAQRWASVLANGGDVWVAEGGPSDFTARVLRNIDSQYPGLNLKKVHVVQHSFGSGFNEANTSRANIAFVKSKAEYIGIANGNSGANNSSNLNQKSSFFVATARQSEFSSEWNAAFNYMDPNRRLDFSDTVELLYLINDTRTKTVDDFARNYLR